MYWRRSSHGGSASGDPWPLKQDSTAHHVRTPRSSIIAVHLVADGRKTIDLCSRSSCGSGDNPLWGYVVKPLSRFQFSAPGPGADRDEGATKKASKLFESKQLLLAIATGRAAAAPAAVMKKPRSNACRLSIAARRPLLGPVPRPLRAITGTSTIEVRTCLWP